MKTRKALAAMLAVLCMTGTMPATTSSASFDPCDVNHDGSVDIVDALTINQHLMGVIYYREYNQLDANRSHTVDSADSRCVLNAAINNSYSTCYIRQYGNGYMQPVNMPAVSSTVTLDSAVNQMNFRQYFGYSYLDNENIAPYTLTVNTASLNNAQASQPRGLIGGDDNRQIAHGYENTGIVSVNDASGFIVGNHQIATAAHCVYDNNGFLSSITVKTYDRTGEPTGVELTVAEVHIPTGYPGSNYYDATYDYALITVTEDLSDYVHFEIGNCYNMTNSEAGSIPLHVTGIPAEIGNGLNTSNSTKTLYTHQGSVYGNSNTSVLCYAIDTSGGQSGSPVYTITRELYDGEFSYTYTALAVHAYYEGNSTNSLYNYGSLMTKHHLLFYKSNNQANYS